jgi:hypothetical protein
VWSPLLTARSSAGRVSAAETRVEEPDNIARARIKNERTEDRTGLLWFKTLKVYLKGR